jgi:hypothetical protein
MEQVGALPSFPPRKLAGGEDGGGTPTLNYIGGAEGGPTE